MSETAIPDINNLIPHRPPFLFVDKLEEAGPEKIIGRKKYTSSEFFFAGHFPGYPVVPGVILVESMAQCGGAGVRAAGVIGEDALFFLATVEKAKFRKQVRPEDEVIFEVENLRISPKSIKQKGKVILNGEVAAEAEWLCLVGKA